MLWKPRTHISELCTSPPGMSRNNIWRFCCRRSIEISIFRGVENRDSDLIHLSRYMRASGTEDWMGDDETPLDGFSWRGGCERDTTGILLWNEVFKVSTRGPYGMWNFRQNPTQRILLPSGDDPVWEATRRPFHGHARNLGLTIYRQRLRDDFRSVDDDFVSSSVQLVTGAFPYEWPFHYWFRTAVPDLRNCTCARR